MVSATEDEAVALLVLTRERVRCCVTVNEQPVVRIFQNRAF